MEKLVENLESTWASFILEAKKQGNKSASRRARVYSVALEKLLKDYRKQSL